MTATSEGLPKYVRVAVALRGQIAAGTLRPGQPAPSGAALSRLTGYSVLTCRRALRVLLTDGLLTPGPSRNARPRVSSNAQPRAERDLATATRALSAELAARRRAHGLTQPELAALAGMSVTTVGHAETGRLWQSRRFWESADAILAADGALLRLHDAYRQAIAAAASQAAGPGAAAGGPPWALAAVTGGPRAGDDWDQQSSERGRLPGDDATAAVTGVPALAAGPGPVTSGRTVPSCVTIVWGDGSVTTVHPPSAPAAEAAPGNAALSG
jgi:DNA-binding transcriptional regulator YhcF (GntR family)